MGVCQPSQSAAPIIVLHTRLSFKEKQIAFFNLGTGNAIYLVLRQEDTTHI